MSREPFEIAGRKVAAGTRAVVEIPVSVLSDQTPMSLSVHVIHGRRPGPTVFVSACIHGDEIIGVEIIRRLIRTPQLRSIAGTLICIPVVNTYGFISHSRYLPDRRDLNRSFPGAASGSLAARLADIFMTEVVERCDAGIDLHSAAQNRTNLPQIRVDTGVPEAFELAREFASPVVVHSSLRDGSLRGAAQARGKPVIVYESGEALRFDETALRLGVKGVLRVLRKLDMIRADKGLKSKLVSELSKKSTWLRAPAGGVLRMHRSIGQHVEKGELIGVLSDPLGEHDEEILSPVPGLIIGRTMLPIVNEGDAICHVAEIVKRRNDEPMAQLDDMLGSDPLFDEDEII
ncbi:succinylglutamate desuccinylase/aspartoacylase family protein [Maricaulis parjimensis]|uniref:succinylglutamate desuccinylase/aspartoacylase family protein n=1 Tax=Maricaulis parjimensis TaxID=144023 RepID=UPI001939D3A0|nr:succinylglutamate desuccinylase/aspartoacylase family protein [Maricaulis parjimensis]